MDIEKFTERARGFIQSAQSLAVREDNQQFVPEHLLKVLIDDEEGLAARLINAAGGNIKGAKGVDPSQFKRAAQLGVTKINIDTDGRLVWMRVHREYFRDHPENFDFRPIGKIFMAEYAKFIADKNEKLGSAGQLDSVREFLSK